MSGFYASPDRYDREMRSTPVLEQDLHFWAEVMVSGGEWLVLEPTPGYELLAPSQTLWQRIRVAVVSALRWAGRNPLGITCLALMLALVWLRRRQLADALVSAAIRWFPARSWQGSVGRTIWLLERRGSWAGRARPAFQTRTHWLRDAMPDSDGVVADLGCVAEWASYGPRQTAPWRDDEVRRLCRRALDQWTLRRLRQAGGSENLWGIRA